MSQGWNGKYEYTNKLGITITADRAMKWLNEDREVPLSVEEIVCRFYFREKALSDDKARKASGKLAERLYTPDLTKVPDEHIPPVLDAAVETIVQVDADLAAGKNPRIAGRSAAKAKPAAVKPADAKAVIVAKAPVVKKAERKVKEPTMTAEQRAARIAELEAALAAKAQ